MSTLRFPFADAKAWLVESVRRRLPGDLCHSAATLVDLHLDPANFAMPLDVRDPQLHEALRFGETLPNLRQYVTFEDTTTIAGVCRVMVRTHLNRSGVSFVSGRIPGRLTQHLSRWQRAKTLSPRVLALFPTNAPKALLEHYCNYENLLEAWTSLAKSRLDTKYRDDPYAFRDSDVKSLDCLRRHPYDPMRRGLPAGVHDNWAKVVWGVHSGLVHLKKHYELDPARLRGALDSASSSFETVNALVRHTGGPGPTKIVQYGETLAGSFFADLGETRFVKSDVHVVEMVAAVSGRLSVSGKEAIHVVQRAAAEHGVAPRAVDKLMYLAGSSEFYLYGPRLRDAKEEKRKFRLALAHHAGGQKAADALAALTDQ